jgi:hypothetical protein
LVISGIRSDGKHVMQLINMKKEAVSVDVSGFESQQIDVTSTTEANNWEILKGITKTKNGKTEFQVKAQSVNTLVFN